MKINSSKINSDSKIVVACSGGSDSLALLALLNDLDVEIQPIYVDHDTKQASKFWKAVKKACKKLQVPNEPIKLEIEGALGKSNFEEKARNQRYKLLNNWAKENSYDYVAVGHTIDDQTETVLFNLIRGSVEGLGGMQVFTKNIWRPMLFTHRKEDTKQICNENKIKFVDDKANKNSKYARVQIRSELIPMMNQIMDRDVSPIIARNSQIIRSENHFLNNLAKNSWPKEDEPLAKNLADLDDVVALRAIRMWIGYPRIRSRDAKRVLDVARGKSKATQIEGHVRVWRSKGVMYFERKKSK